MWEDAGHLQPLGMALAWVLARVSLYNWPLTCVITLLLLAAPVLAKDARMGQPHDSDGARGNRRKQIPRHVLVASRLRTARDDKIVSEKTWRKTEPSQFSAGYLARTWRSHTWAKPSLRVSCYVFFPLR